MERMRNDEQKMPGVGQERERQDRGQGQEQEKGPDRGTPQRRNPSEDFPKRDERQDRQPLDPNPAGTGKNPLPKERR